MSTARPRTGRVAVFCAHYPPHVGGVERYTSSLWGRLARRGWQVLVVATDTHGPGTAPADPGVMVWRLPARNVIEGRVPVPTPSAELAVLWRALRTAPPDIIACNTRFFPTSLLAALLARRTGRPLLHIEHGSAPVTLQRPIVDVALAIGDQLLGSYVLGSADRCLGVSRAAARFLGAAFGIESVGVLSNGVDTASWDHAVVDYRRRLGISSDDVLIVFVGRLIEAKGVPDLLEVFARLEGGLGTRPRLAVAGDGPLANEVARKARTAIVSPSLDRSARPTFTTCSSLLTSWSTRRHIPKAFRACCSRAPPRVPRLLRQRSVARGS